MSKPPDFSLDTIFLIMSRACMICSNPDCSTVTIGPSDASAELKLKIGEAAHIAGKTNQSARWDSAMTDKDRAHSANGIWLCAACHEMVDKNKGADYPVYVLQEWKRTHEMFIHSLLTTHKSPLARLRQRARVGEVAQDFVDRLQRRGALFMNPASEVPKFVVSSVAQLRDELLVLARKAAPDTKLKQLINDFANDARSFMNITSTCPSWEWEELETLRRRAGFTLRVLRDKYGCSITGPITRIIPS
jgi:hypothetical protein